MVTSFSGAETSSHVPWFSTSYPCGLFQTNVYTPPGRGIDLAPGDLPTRRTHPPARRVTQRERIEHHLAWYVERPRDLERQVARRRERRLPTVSMPSRSAPRSRPGNRRGAAGGRAPAAPARNRTPRASASPPCRAW